MIAVVVPSLGDSDALASLLADLPLKIELVVVAGAEDPALDRLLAGRAGARVLRTEAGRGRQMNAGAAAASADWLLFLHADSRLPSGWHAAIAATDPAVEGGWFRFGLDDTAWQARVIERLVAWRVRTLKLPYGDQGLFVRRDLFARLGGFREWPLMEDVDFVRRLTAATRTLEIPLTLLTSSRRWRRDGWVRRSARNLALISLYFAGVAPTRLARWYGGEREGRK